MNLHSKFQILLGASLAQEANQDQGLGILKARTIYKKDLFHFSLILFCYLTRKHQNLIFKKFNLRRHVECMVGNDLEVKSMNCINFYFRNFTLSLNIKIHTTLTKKTYNLK